MAAPKSSPLHGGPTSGAALECRWTDAPPVMDGNREDAAWQGAAVIDGFAQPWLEGGPAAKEGTKVRLLWDREWLYFLAEMEDGDVSAVVREHDGPMWENDVFEVFLQPSDKHEGYFEFEVNPANAVLDAFFRGVESWRDPEQLKRDKFHLETRVVIKGTLNDSGDRDSGWIVEGRIPWSDFGRAGGRPTPDEIWRVNLARVNGAAPGSELSTIAPLKAASFHRTAEYAKLRFVGPEIRRGEVWKNTRLQGSPDGPAPYVTQPVWRGLKAFNLVTVEMAPDKEWVWFIQQEKYRDGVTPIGRFRASGDGSDAEQLLTVDEVVYTMAFHPKFAENGYVFFGAHGPVSKAPRTSRVVRYTVRDGRPDPASRTMIIEWPGDGHNGAAIAFGGDGKLFVTSGDGTHDADLDHVGQNPQSLRSKVLRIDVDRPADGKAYSVPADNPFVGDARFAPETWAYGLRNPWRMAFDAPSGQLWVGENGNDAWEYARLVQRGENYGWSRYEGSHFFRATEPLGPHPVTFPAIEHPHSEFRSLTGGIVYRGRIFPELIGAYVYADWGTGRVWAAKHDGRKLEWQRELCDTPYAISQIAQDANGELLVVDYGTGAGGFAYRLAKAEPQLQVVPFPERLSGTGLFSDVREVKPASGVLPYVINVPGWHDGAESVHHMALPGDGKLELRSSKSWQAPDGTALAQTLNIGGRRIETRVLLKQQNDWAGYSYVWNAEQSEATLAPKAGADMEIGGGQPWRVPSRAECMMCHSRQANFALTLHDAQLNHGDQLQRWERMGLLSSNAAAFDRERAQFGKTPRPASSEERQRGSPVTGLLPRNPDRLAKFVKSNDEGATVEQRARSYLGVNCAHCHTIYGGGNSPMEFDWFVSLKEMQTIDRAPEHGTLDLENARVVAPGAPGRSVLIPRVARRGPGQMPPVGTRVGDPEGVRVLAEWVMSLRE